MDSPDDQYGIPVHSFAKNKREQIRIDIRTFYEADGKFKPSAKGVTLNKDLYPELLKGVMELASVLGIDLDALADDAGDKPTT
jgi:hypothetical protein